MPSVSVIMPVYNSEKYLKKAVQSVLGQSYEDFELLLIDDGSSDKSGDICDGFAAADARVKVIHKENGGICSARNAGLDLASGRYISFIDNDDAYEKDMLKDSVGAMERNAVDWVRFSRLRRTIYDDGTVKTDSNGVCAIVRMGAEAVIKNNELLEKYCVIKRAGALYGIWNALFRRDLIEKSHIRFDTGVKFGGEDWLFNIEYFKSVKSIAFLGENLYIYNRRVTHSTSAKYDFNRIEAVLKVAESENKMSRELELSKYFEPVNLFLLTINCSECGKIMAHPGCGLTSAEKKGILKTLKRDTLKEGKGFMRQALSLFSLSKNKGFLSLMLCFNMYSLFLFLLKVKFRLKKEI